MASATDLRKRTDSPFECRVRFTSRLRHAQSVPPNESLSPRDLPSRSAAPATHENSGHGVPGLHPTHPTPPQPSTPQRDPDDERRIAELEQTLAADRERIEKVLAGLQTSMAEFREYQGVKLSEWQHAAVELAMAMSARLLHERFASDAFPVEDMVRDMVAQMDDDPVAIRLNPLDVQLLESRLGGSPLLPGRDDPRITPDPSMTRGECRIEGKSSILLSDVVRELTQIRDDLLRSLGNART